MLANPSQQVAKINSLKFNDNLSNFKKLQNFWILWWLRKLPQNCRWIVEKHQVPALPQRIHLGVMWMIARFWPQRRRKNWIPKCALNMFFEISCSKQAKTIVEKNMSQVMQLLNLVMLIMLSFCFTWHSLIITRCGKRFHEDLQVSFCGFAS